MDKKIIIVIVIAAIVGSAGWYFTRHVSPEDMIAPVVVAPPAAPDKSLSGVGWSTLANEEQAVNEAVTMMMAELDGAPNFAFVYCASGYEEEKVLAEVNRLLPGTKIIGGNSGYGITTPGGYFWYPVAAQSFGILGIASPKIVWGVGSSPVDVLSSRDAAKAAVTAAITDAGKTAEDIPDLVISVPTFGMEQENALKGIADVVGVETPVFGAYTADKGIAGDWRLFANDQVYHNGISIAVVYTDFKIGTFREHGFEVTEQGGVVTKADKNTLIEIDGRPAAVVYNELIGGLLTAEVNDPATASVSKVRVTSALNPLAKVVLDAQGKEYYVPALPVKILADRSIVFDSMFEPGDKLRILRGDWEILLNRLRTTPEKAIAQYGINKDKIIFAVNSFCCATHYALPESERPKSPEILKEGVGDVPFIGVCACGIQSPEPGMGNMYGSMANGILIFSEESK